MYTPNLIETMRITGYLFFKKEVPDKEKFEIKHQLLGICAFCKNSIGKISFFHYIIDRNANGEFPEVWNTKIRVIYIGEGDHCEKDDRGWAEKRSNGLNIIGESYRVRKGESMNKVLKGIQGYLKEFPKYNALYNCQHFANNLYNKMTGKKEEFINKEIMNNGKKLTYNFQ